MEKKVHNVVADVANRYQYRQETCSVAIRILNDKYGINCCRDDIKAHDYLVDALDLYTERENN